MSDTGMNVFTGAPGYAGFYGPSASGANVAVYIARAKNVMQADGTVNTSVLSGGANVVNNGFLADTYNIQWGRVVQVRRVFNNSQPIAVVGYGQGTVTLGGLLGTYDGFKDIIGGDQATGNTDLCNPLVISIEGSGSYSKCENYAVANQDAQKGVQFLLTSCLLSTINVTGQIESNSGQLLQQANVVFNIGGFRIIPVGKKKITVD